MYLILSQSAPLITLIGVGFVLKLAGILQGDDRHAVVRLIFNVTLPSVVFLSLSTAGVKPRTLLLLAACGAAIPLAVHRVAVRVVPRLHMSRETEGVVVLSTLVSSVMMFLAPFFLTFYGQVGLGRVAAFDLGNSTIGSSYAYYVATRFGRDSTWDCKTAARRILKVPMLWANVLALVVNVTGVTVPSVLGAVLESIAAANGPLAMLILGSFIELRLPAFRPMLLAVGLRMGFGWLVGQALVYLLALRGLERTVVSLAAAAPVGIMPLIYASLLGLDVQFAAAILSFSILVGIVLTPILLWVHGLP